MRYYDSIEGRMRVKRRYVWAIWAFLLGSLLGSGCSVYVVDWLGH